MSLRLKDWKCRGCGRIFEEMIRVQSPHTPRCCGKRAVEVHVAAAPLNIKSGYNASMGRHFSSAREFEKHLKNMGCHVADKAEIEESIHGPTGPPKSTVNKEKLKECAERAYSQLHTSGQI